MFESKKVGDVRLLLVMANNHEFLQLPKGEQTKQRLFNYPQVIQRSTIADDNLHGVYQESKRWTVSDLASKREIILDGLGWGRLPEHEIVGDLEKGNLVELRFIEDPVSLPILLSSQKTRGARLKCLRLFGIVFYTRAC